MIFLKRYKRYMGCILYKQTITNKYKKYFYTYIIHISGINVFVRIVYDKNYSLQIRYGKYVYSPSESHYKFNSDTKTLITISDLNINMYYGCGYKRTIKAAKKEKWIQCYSTKYKIPRDCFTVSDKNMNAERHIELIKTKPLIGICL